MDGKKESAGGPGGAGFHQTISGGLLRIFKVGALIIGDSGIGKSESSLELVTRGHKLVSDDVVHVTREGPGRLVGRAPALSRNFMEIRGLGIINIREIFGPSSICSKSRIDLIFRLKKWRHGLELDRLGLNLPEDEIILGEKVPQVFIPVAPGRNVATLIEVACRVHLLRMKGYHAPHEIMKRLDRALS
jgi:HPr kinase/phosphorylase